MSIKLHYYILYSCFYRNDAISYPKPNYPVDSLTYLYELRIVVSIRLKRVVFGEKGSNNTACPTITNKI